MHAQLEWLDDPRVFRVNQMAAHSDHDWYQDYRQLANKKVVFTNH